MPRLPLGAGAALGFLAAMLAVEVLLLSRRAYLPPDPGYRIRALVPPDGVSHGPAIRLAVLGDSTVAGVGSPTADGSLPVHVAQRVASATGRPVEVVGHGVSGARTASVLERQLPAVQSGTDVVLLVVGSNDATHLTFWPRFRRQVHDLLAGSRRMGSGVVLAGTPRFHRNQVLPEPIRTIIDRYAALLRGQQHAAVRDVPGARFVDLAADASPRFLGVPEATSPDGFHPSPIGYGFWADALAPEVVAALPAR